MWILQYFVLMFLLPLKQFASLIKRILMFMYAMVPPKGIEQCVRRLSKVNRTETLIILFYDQCCDYIDTAKARVNK